MRADAIVGERMPTAAIARTPAMLFLIVFIFLLQTVELKRKQTGLEAVPRKVAEFLNRCSGRRLAASRMPHD
jgi:hypothetical protein